MIMENTPHKQIKPRTEKTMMIANGNSSQLLWYTDVEVIFVQLLSTSHVCVVML